MDFWIRSVLVPFPLLVVFVDTLGDLLVGVHALEQDTVCALLEMRK
jgi:hypothetical protein